MKKLMMLVLICASIFTYSQSYASGDVVFPDKKSSKSVKAQTTKKTYGKVRNVKKSNRQRGFNYYKYANSRGYLKAMGRAINGG